MLKPTEAERFLDASPELALARPKEKNSAVYVTRTGGRYLALERRLKTVAKVHVEPVLNVGALKFSLNTEVNHLPPEAPRVHLPVPCLTGPYGGRAGNEAWRIRLSSEADLAILVKSYAACPGR